MRPVFYLAACLGLVPVVFAFASCGSSGPSGFAGDDGGTGADVIQPQGDGDINPFADTGTTDSGGNCGKCSGDLHNVVDCNDNVVTACPPDQGCAAGACVPACDAAKANKSSVGCDYYAVPATDFTGQTCFAVFVVEHVGLARHGRRVDAARRPSPRTFGLRAPGHGQEPHLHALITNGRSPRAASPSSSCPTTTRRARRPTAASTAARASRARQLTNAFHITPTRPVVLYDHLPVRRRMQRRHRRDAPAPDVGVGRQLRRDRRVERDRLRQPVDRVRRRSEDNTTSASCRRRTSSAGRGVAAVPGKLDARTT